MARKNLLKLSGCGIGGGIVKRSIYLRRQLLVCRCGKPATRDKFGVLACRSCRKDKERIETKRLKIEENDRMLRGIFDEE